MNEAIWPSTAPMNPAATAARDEARLMFRQRAIGFSRGHGVGSPLLGAACAALRAGRPDDFGAAVDRVRRQLDELEELWRAALGEPSATVPS